MTLTMYCTIPHIIFRLYAGGGGPNTIFSVVWPSGLFHQQVVSDLLYGIVKELNLEVLLLLIFNTLLRPSLKGQYSLGQCHKKNNICCVHNLTFKIFISKYLPVFQ